MQEIAVEKASQKARDLYNKGMLALERGNFDFAIEMLFACVEMEPGLLVARKGLRVAEIKRSRQTRKNALGNLFSSASGYPAYLKAQTLLKSGKNDQALSVTETLFKTNPLDLKTVKLFVECCTAAAMPNAAIQTLELVREFNQDDVYVLSCLGSLYQKVGRNKSAKECVEKLCELKPNDPEFKKLIKDITAIDSMTVWDEARDFRDVIKDKKEATMLETENKAVTSEKDAGLLITDVLKKLEAEPENMKLYRSAARLYVQQKKFPEAVAVLQKAIALSPGDPELDLTLTSTKVAQYDHEIALLQNSGRESEANELINHKVQFVFDDLADRVKRYPNDLKLKYEWGLMLFEHEYYNEAIQQLQASQRSPTHLVNSLYYLALCFKNKKQYDLAHEQLLKALNESVIMDSSRKNILYELGTVSELMNETDRAMGYFKEIYQVDIGYKDVAQKIEKAYAKQG